jgi:hypothetical protein
LALGIVTLEHHGRPDTQNVTGEVHF